MQIHQSVEKLIKEITKLEAFHNHQLSREDEPFFILTVEKYSKIVITPNDSNHKLDQYRIEVRDRYDKTMYSTIDYDPYSETYKSLLGVATFEEVIEKLKTALEQR
ncbi:hypothetical protein JOD03_002545 [Chryseomicrobium aureum]|uniref:hypothetical protein n=1 Tax=Chryseomicrobium aureum TaxID=1441723 RepID=UPI00195C3A44|nr:hypothetical protein [Chryseomicrobium aureum]MBM7707598.1 hypothetical protein [Chryseomicrobium aureum]